MSDTPTKNSPRERPVALKDATVVKSVTMAGGHEVLHDCDDSQASYDGHLWLYRDAEGQAVIVGGRSWESAFERAMDTLPEIPASDLPEAHGYDGWCDGGYEITLATYSPETAQARFEAACARAHEGDGEYPELIEGYRYQSNTGPEGTCITSVSLNGERLEPLTPALLARLGWRLRVGVW